MDLKSPRNLRTCSLEPLDRAAVHPKHVAVRILISELVAMLDGYLGSPDESEQRLVFPSLAFAHPTPAIPVKATRCSFFDTR